ncbi:hypothetical protein DMH15_28835 [Streptomyces sp. WAC 06725]|uniref:hypothetical protein n=1 Tax=Streptomyces sp. WAC 06725 TaxID=2203209 RepID=UPI000F7387C6|nr:hypothetical protein [Streptomyces sp. WAC 06725]RSO27436.1 hypothetical protein DMH15_28835 [Streptomyces sp. WAC 06725]
MTHTRAQQGENSDLCPDIAFTVPADHYRRCGPEAARRIARADGWRIIAPGRSVGNGKAPADRDGLAPAIPAPRGNTA